MANQANNQRQNRQGRQRIRYNFQNDLIVTQGQQVQVGCAISYETLASFLQAIQEYNKHAVAINQPAMKITQSSGALEGVLWLWSNAIHQGNYQALW